MAASRSWDETSPPDSQQVSQGALRIRQFKEDVRERMAVDHIWDDAVGTDGRHTKATIKKLGSNPSPVADHGILFTKDVSGVPELHYIDKDGAVTQLTSGGNIDSLARSDFKFKTIGDGRSNGTGLTDDGTLTGWNLDLDSVYMFEGLVLITSNANADFKYQFEFSETPQRISTFNAWSDDSDTAQITEDQGNPVFVIDCKAGEELVALKISGFVETNLLSSSTVDFQWAQNVADGGVTTRVIQGSWMRFTKLGAG